MPIERLASAARVLLAGALTLASPVFAADVSMTIASGLPQTMYRSSVDGCAPIDTPDINPRAYRDADGGVSMFALHYVNRALRGPDLSHLKIDCSIALDSGLDANPAHYNDRRYMTATWTDDGHRVLGIVHHEYHADTHGDCAAKSDLGCWYNSILSVSSGDGGHSFTLDKPAVVASAPFRQDVGQGRHRGFFNPSNIVSDGRYKYFMSSTTGWDGQPYGVCLFRSATPFESGSWRAFDGKDFTVQFHDPYGKAGAAQKPCAIIPPFIFPVGSITRDTTHDRWIATWAAARNDGAFPFSGFYYATSSDLIAWSQPRLLLAGPILADGVCGGSLIAYPSVIDEKAKSRNFDDTGASPWLYYVSIRMRGCETGERALMRERLAIAVRKEDPTR